MNRIAIKGLLSEPTFLLTLNHDKAGDLAQEAWCLMLRARHRLKPRGNCPAYLVTTALN